MRCLTCCRALDHNGPDLRCMIDWVLRLGEILHLFKLVHSAAVVQGNPSSHSGNPYWHFFRIYWPQVPINLQSGPQMLKFLSSNLSTSPLFIFTTGKITSTLARNWQVIAFLVIEFCLSGFCMAEPKKNFCLAQALVQRERDLAVHQAAQQSQQAQQAQQALLAHHQVRQ